MNEIGPIGDLQSFLISPDGALSLVDTAPTGGNGPTFTNPVSTGEVSAMNVSEAPFFVFVFLFFPFVLPGHHQNALIANMCFYSRYSLVPRMHRLFLPLLVIQRDSSPLIHRSWSSSPLEMAHQTHTCHWNSMARCSYQTWCVALSLPQLITRFLMTFFPPPALSFFF